MIRRLLVVLACLALAPAASAATFIVTTTTDAADALPGDGICGTTDSATCSLRAAVQEANALDGDDAIVLGAGTYTLTIPGESEDAAATGDLDVTEELTVSGASAATTVIDGNDLDRIFHSQNDVPLTLRDLTVRNGRGGSDDNGGGISARGPLTLERVAVVDNEVALGSGMGGGGVAVDRALTVVDSTFSGNTGDGSGGGALYLASGAGPVSIVRSVLTGNTARDSGGGAIYHWAYYGLTIEDSTLSGNTALADGGGAIFNRRASTLTGTTFSGNVATGNNGGALMLFGGDATIVNSTLSGNTSSFDGGAIYAGAVLRLESSTVTGNSAGSGVGGIYRPQSGTAKNSIVAGNAGGDCSHAFGTLEGHNLQGQAGCGFDLTGAPLLGPLAANGGETETHALLAGSPAVDAGAGCPPPATDQRGVARPAGASCDLGAYEGGTAAAGPRVTVSAPTALPPGGGPFDIDVTLHNDRGTALAGVSATLELGNGLAAGTTSADAGSLADGESDAVQFAVTAPSTCADATYTYAIVTDWDGRTGDPGRSEGSVTVQGTCGSVGGTVSAVGFGTLGGAEVRLCTLAGVCRTATSGTGGAYTLSGLAAGSYTVTALPPLDQAYAALRPLTLGPLTVAERSVTTQNLVLSELRAQPQSVDIPGVPQSDTGVPNLRRARTIRYSEPTCDGATVTWTLLQNGSTVASGPMQRVNPDTTPPVYEADLSGASASGWLELRITKACPDGSGGVLSFDVAYIDPSGWVRDLSGARVPGATVTLFRADAATGPWTQVPNGSLIMSPNNRRNPDTTDAEGWFGWDVVAGYYKVLAEQSGCGSVESRVMEIPPPVFDLDLVLPCNAPVVASGSSPSSPSTSTGGGAAPAAPAAAPASPRVAPKPAAVLPRAARLSRATKVLVSRVRGGWVVRFRLRSTAATRVTVSGARFARGSRVGRVVSGKARGIIHASAGAGTTPLALRVAKRRGVVVVRTGAATLRVPFRAR